MDRRPVDSSNLASVGYEPSSQILEVEFKSGLLYHYFRVPPAKFEALMAADSVGKYLNAEIKPHHGYEQLRDDGARNLAHAQRQLDADGIEVGVSRQALDETLRELHFLRFAYGYGVNDPELQTIVQEYADTHGWPAPAAYVSGMQN